MMELTRSEVLFYSGIGIVIISIILAFSFFVIFYITGKRIRLELEKEYGVLE